MYNKYKNRGKERNIRKFFYFSKEKMNQKNEIDNFENVLYKHYKYYKS